jgi:hypothetical protein
LEGWCAAGRSVWLLRQILYNKLISVYRLNWRELETDQHHIITPHRFCDLSNPVLKENKPVNYSKCTVSYKWINAVCCMAHDRRVSPLLPPSRHSQNLTSWITNLSQTHNHNNLLWNISPSTLQLTSAKSEVGLTWPVM